MQLFNGQSFWAVVELSENNLYNVHTSHRFPVVVIDWDLTRAVHWDEDYEDWREHLVMMLVELRKHIPPGEFRADARRAIVRQYHDAFPIGKS